jgi:hypothetical protein
VPTKRDYLALVPGVEEEYVPANEAKRLVLAGRPSFRGYRELPLVVRHAWESYAVVDQALEHLEQGQFLEAALLSDAVLSDDRAGGIVDTRVTALLGLPMKFEWQGQSGGAQEESEEVRALQQEIAEWTERNWERMFPSATMKEFFRSGLMLNAGVGELIWDWTPDGKVLPTLKTWHTQFVYWRWDTRSYWLVHQDGVLELAPGDGHWVLSSPNGHEHGWLYALLRRLAKLWIDRVFTLRDYARSSEKFGLGVVKAKMPSPRDVKDKERFEAQVSNLANESAVFLPQGPDGKAGFDLEMMETDEGTSWQSFEKRLGYLDSSMAIATLGQNLTTEVKEGSRAAAQVHENVRADFLKSDAQGLASLLKTQALTPMVAYNWGHRAAALGVDVSRLVPNVTWEAEPVEDVGASSVATAAAGAALVDFQTAGAPVDKRAFLQKFNVPVLDEAALPARPPPGGDVNERPPAEARRAAAARLARVSAAAKGRALVDELVEATRKAGANALAGRREQLLRICLSGRSFDEMKAAIRKLYFEMKPSKLREVVAKSWVVGQHLGRLAASVDHRRS